MKGRAVDIRRSASGLLGFWLLLSSGCTISSGTPPYRAHPVNAARIEDLQQPGGFLGLTPATPKRIDCPFCSASNPLGQKRCSFCGKRLSMLPSWTPCPACSKTGKGLKGEACPACQGRGWIQADDDDVSPEDDSF